MKIKELLKKKEKFVKLNFLAYPVLSKSPHQKFLKEQSSETALQLTAYVLL